MSQLSNKIQISIPIKTKVASCWLVVAVFITEFCFYATAAFGGASVAVLDGIFIEFGIVFVFSLLLFSALLNGKKWAWRGATAVCLMAAIFFFYQLVVTLILVKKDTNELFYYGFGYNLYFIIFFLIFFIPLIILLLDRKNYFAAVEGAGNKAN